MTEVNPTLETLASSLVNMCISIYNTVQSQLLPTPAKSHYTFNLRDLSKVFQGILMANPSGVDVSMNNIFLF